MFCCSAVWFSFVARWQRILRNLGNLWVNLKNYCSFSLGVPWFLPMPLFQNAAKLREKETGKSVTMRIPVRLQRWEDSVLWPRGAFATLITEEMHKEKQSDVINLLLLHRVYLEQFAHWCAVSGCSQLAVAGSAGFWCGTGVTGSSSQTLGWQSCTPRNLGRSPLQRQNTKQRLPLTCRRPLLSAEEHHFWLLPIENWSVLCQRVFFFNVYIWRRCWSSVS